MTTTQRLTFFALPQVLIFHLQRHHHSFKIEDRVIFPFELEMGQFCSSMNLDLEAQERVYRVTGIVEHIGSLDSGHYVAYVRSRQDVDEWYRISDDQVESVTLERLQKVPAYLLFFAGAQSPPK